MAAFEVYEVTGADTWQPALAPSRHESALTYICPMCECATTLNVQLGSDGAPTETEVWCHRCGIGAQVTIAGVATTRTGP